MPVANAADPDQPFIYVGQDFRRTGGWELEDAPTEIEPWRAPIDGMIGRHFMTIGNLVNQDQTLLATIVSFGLHYSLTSLFDLILP